jgi:hypothetical protein
MRPKWDFIVRLRASDAVTGAEGLTVTSQTNKTPLKNMSAEKLWVCHYTSQVEIVELL